MANCMCKHDLKTLQLIEVNPLCSVHGDEAQPLPISSEHPIAHEAVMRELRDSLLARLAYGVTKYGEPLRPFNGRDQSRDAWEEMIDFLVYYWCERYEAKARREGKIELSDEPHLGLATTRELFNELVTRLELYSMSTEWSTERQAAAQVEIIRNMLRPAVLDYRTVDS